MYTPKSGINAGKENREKIEQYLKEHPDTNGIEIAEALNISKVTVYKHLGEIRKEYLNRQK